MKLVYPSEPIQQSIIKDLLCARSHGEQKASAHPLAVEERDTHLSSSALKQASVRGAR